MPNTTTAQLITIINRADGGVTAHRTGCRDIAREVKGTHADSFEMGEFASQREVFLCYNADFLDEGQAEDEVYSIDFRPCCELPAEVAAEVADYTYAVKQASIGAGKWFVTETVRGSEAVVGSVYGYGSEAEAREVADRLAAPSHLDNATATVEAKPMRSPGTANARVLAEVAAELAAIEAQEAADIAADDARRADELAYVRTTYGDQAAALVANGWTVDSAISHVSGTCDLELCTGDHGHAWAVLVAEVTGRPEAAQAEREAELARSMAAVRDAAVAAGRTDVVDALDALEHTKAVADYANDRGDYSAVRATAAKLTEGRTLTADEAEAAGLDTRGITGSGPAGRFTTRDGRNAADGTLSGLYESQR